MPHRVDVRCPGCDARAAFEFAEVVRIRLAKDVAYFQRSEAFEYRLFQDSAGSRWHGAIFYHGLSGHTSGTIRDLPDGYRPEDWDHGEYLYRSHDLDIGAVACGACGYRKRHTLRWPEEAYFQVEYRGKILWAFNGESAAELLNYVRSEHRKREGYKWEAFLRHVPSNFLRKGARETVSKKLQRLLPNADGSRH